MDWKQLTILVICVALPICAVLWRTRRRPLEMLKSGARYELVVRARSVRVSTSEVELQLYGGLMSKPSMYINFALDPADPAAGSFAKHVSEKRKFRVVVEEIK